MIRILFISLLVVLAVSGNRETHRLISVYGGAEVAQDIVHDKDTNTVTVTVSQTPALKNQVPTVNYHDFNTKLVAFKDIEHDVCLLTYAPIPFATPGVYKLGRTTLTLPYKATIKSQEMTSEEVETVAGANIAEFCSEYRTLWMDLVPKHDSIPEKRAADGLEPCLFNCGWCLVEANKGYQIPRQ